MYRFNAQHSSIVRESTTLRHNFLIQLIGGLLNIIVLLVLTPLLVHAIGLERFGVLLVILSLTIYVGIADFGIGAAVSQKLSAVFCGGQGRQILGIGIGLSLLFGTFGGCLFAAISLPTVGRFIGLDAGLVHELSASGPSLILLGVTTVVTGVPQGALFGLSRFLVLNLLTILASANAVLFPYLYVNLVGSDLNGLVFSIALAHLLSGGLALLACWQSGLTPKIFPIDPALARGLFAYGGWSTLSGAFHRVTNSLDRPLIAIIVGAGAVPFFAIPQGLLTRSNLVVAALMTAAFPKLARASADEEIGPLTRACYRSLCMLGPAYVAGVSILPKFLAIWLGDDFSSRAATVGCILAVSLWIDALSFVPYTLMQAKSTLSRDVRISTFIALPNVVLLCGALAVAGVKGAALVAVLRSLLYFCGRAVATAMTGLPLFQVSVQSGLVIVGAVIATMPLNELSRSIGGFLIVACSTLVAFANRPQFIDELLVSSIALLRKPRDAFKVIDADLPDENKKRLEQSNVRNFANR